MNDPLSSQVRSAHHSAGKTGQDLRKLGDSRVPADRPVLPQEFTRVSFIGSRAFAIRTPEIGEVGLSQSEIFHAIANAIYIEKSI